MCLQHGVIRYDIVCLIDLFVSAVRKFQTTPVSSVLDKDDLGKKSLIRHAQAMKLELSSMYDVQQGTAVTTTE